MTDAPSRRRGGELDPEVRAEFTELTTEFDGAAEWKTVVAAFGEYLHQGPRARPVVGRSPA